MPTYEEKIEAKAAEIDAMHNLGLSYAYEFAVGTLDGFLLSVGIEPGEWYDTTTADGEGAELVPEALAYLTFRGVIYRHPEHPEWISVRDESEGL